MWTTGSARGGAAGGRTAPSTRLNRAFALQVVFLIGMWILFGLNATSARDQARDDAVQSLTNVSAALAMDLSHNLELVDHSLQSAANAWHNDEIRALKPSLRQLVLFDRSMSTAAFGPLIIVDPYGSVQARSDERQLDPYGVAATSPQETKAVDTFADRADFKAHLENDGLGLYVGPGIVNPADGEWSIPLSRRLTTSEGDFAGIVSGTLRMAYVQDAYRRIVLRSDQLLGLATDEGKLLAHRPELRPDVGLGPPQLGAIAVRTDPQYLQGVFEAKSRVDGNDKLYAYHRVGKLPLVQYAAMPVAKVYADWRQRTLVIACFLGLLSVGTMTLQLMLGRELRSRIAAERLLEELASQDGLTGIANRRVFDHAVEREWQLAMRRGSAVGLLMIDVDHFKPFNDLYGHQAGDAALKLVAARIAAVAERCGGLACRYGGEEFALLLPAIIGSGAQIAQDLLLGIRRCNLPNGGAPAGIVTISVGVAATVPQAGDLAGTLVASADQQLYAAKQAGRDCCRFAAPLDRGVAA